MCHNPFEQAILSVLSKSGEITRSLPYSCALCTSVTEERIAKLYLNAVAGAAVPDSPFTVHYPASNHAQLIVRQSGAPSLWSTKALFSEECIPIVRRLQQTTAFLSFLLDNGYADQEPLPKELIPCAPSGIGTEWRCYRSLPKDLICDVCFFRQISVVIRPSAFNNDCVF